MAVNGELMINSHVCFLVFFSFWAWPGCGGAGSADQPHSGRGGGGATAYERDGGASGRGAGGTKAGAGGSAGNRPPTPPPEMPRELGEPDGIYCQSNFNDPPAQTCAAGSRCCPADDVVNEGAQVCIPDRGKCPACDSLVCAQLLCDGPEDCAGASFCCYSRRTCQGKAEDCTAAAEAFQSAEFASVECKARCVGDQRDPDHGAVVCKDDRDCPGRYVVGRCKPLMVGMLPYGIKVCSEP